MKYLVDTGEGKTINGFSDTLLIKAKERGTSGGFLSNTKTV